MPIKFGQPLDVLIGTPKDDGSMEYMKLNGISSVSETELVDDPIDDFIFEMRSTWHGEFKLASKSPLALYYFFIHGNDLYLRFPKKLRRKKRRNNK